MDFLNELRRDFLYSYEDELWKELNKEEGNMKESKLEKDIGLLAESMVIYRARIDGTDGSICNRHNCPVCQEYTGCEGGCPIVEKTGREDCHGTPYKDIRSALAAHGHCSLEHIQALIDEYNFLRDLRIELEGRLEKEQERKAQIALADAATKIQEHAIEEYVNDKMLNRKELTPKKKVEELNGWKVGDEGVVVSLASSPGVKIGDTVTIISIHSSYVDAQGTTGMWSYSTNELKHCAPKTDRNRAVAFLKKKGFEVCDNNTTRLSRTIYAVIPNTKYAALFGAAHFNIDWDKKL